MILNESQGTFILDLSDPMALPILAATRKFLIDEGGYKDLVRRLDPVVDDMRANIDNLVDVLDLRKDAAALSAIMDVSE